LTCSYHQWLQVHKIFHLRFQIIFYIAFILINFGFSNTKGFKRVLIIALHFLTIIQFLSMVSCRFYCKPTNFFIISQFGKHNYMFGFYWNKKMSSYLYLFYQFHELALDIYKNLKIIKLTLICSLKHFSWKNSPKKFHMKKPPWLFIAPQVTLFLGMLKISPKKKNLKELTSYKGKWNFFRNIKKYILLFKMKYLKINKLFNRHVPNPPPSTTSTMVPYT
jgi:hypothetical protein